MDTPAQSGGLVGLFRGLFGAASSTTKASLGFFAQPELWAVRLAALAGVTAIYVKSGAPTFGFEPVVFALSIGLAGLMFEACSAKNVMRSFWEGRFFGAAVWSTLWICAFAYSAFNWISVAAENEAGKTNMHKAAAYRTADVQSASQLAGQRVLELRSKVENLRKAGWESIPLVDGVHVTSVEQAQAIIDRQKANTRQWDMTEGCTKTNGPKTRAFCATYNDAIAAKAGNETRSVTVTEFKAAEDELKAAEADHKKAREVAASTPVETKSERADLLILANIMGVEGEHVEQNVEQISAIFKILAVSVFLSLGAAMMELEKLRLSGPRRRLDIFGRIYRAIYGALFGKDPPNYKTEVHNHVSVSDDRAISELRRLAAQMTVPQLPKGAMA